MEWNTDKQKINAAYFAAINANNILLFQVIHDHYDKLQEVFPLIEFVLERVDAVTTLIESEQLWDADIIVRSALETLVKFAFIAEADETERPQLLHEFWFDLSEISNLKLSEQAKKNLKHTSEKEIYRLAYSSLVLSEEDELSLRSKWPRKVRSTLEQKWSFTGIVNFISEKNKGNPMESFEFITHIYRMSSHITHGDEIGINMIIERKSRIEAERVAVHRAHYLRLISDCYYYCLLTAIYTMKYLKLEPKLFMDLQKSLDEVQELVHQYHMIPFEDELYDKYR